MSSTKPEKSKRKARASMAARADRHRLYEQSVQCVEAEIDFVEETFRERRGRRPLSLREDFCGTAAAACEWVRRRRSHTAMAVDIDPEVQDWGRRHNVAALSKGARARIELLNADVLKVRTEPMDCVLAMNFSYWFFKDRRTLRRYFRRVRDALGADGIFFLDAFGGYDAFRVLRERTKHKGFTYVWHQAAYNPITGDYLCHIDFTFKDGSRLKRAFSYDWRLWTLPELRELLKEAGFTSVTVYWQGTDEESGEANGVFEPTDQGDPDAGWIAYVVAEK